MQAPDRLVADYGDVFEPVPVPPVASATRVHNLLLLGIEYLGGLVLAIDVAVVFVSVIYRYALHNPLDWAEEVASALMVTLIFLGAASVLGRQKHVGIDVFLHQFPSHWRAALEQSADWIEVSVSLMLLVSTIVLLIDSQGQTTSLGLPQWMILAPVLVGSLAMFGFSVTNALSRSGWSFCGTLLAFVIIGVAATVWNVLVPAHGISPVLLLVVGFIGSLLVAVPIAFA